MDQSTYAPFHQHFIVARLDLDVDGTGNTVYACDSQPATAAHGNQRSEWDAGCRFDFENPDYR